MEHDTYQGPTYQGPDEAEVLSWNEHNDHVGDAEEAEEEAMTEAVAQAWHGVGLEEEYPVHLVVESGQPPLCKGAPAKGHTTDTPAEADCQQCLTRWSGLQELLRMPDWSERVALAISLVAPVLADPELFFWLTLEWDVPGGKERQTFKGTIQPNGMDAAAIYEQIVAAYTAKLEPEPIQAVVLDYGLMPLKWQV